MKKQLTLVFAVLIAATTFAQKAKVLKGDFKDLKGITEYNLVFDYSDLEIPKYDNEEAFLEDKMAKREKKEAGSGEKFKASWFSDREERYEPKFIESFNKRYEEFQVGKDLPNAEYTMKVHTTLLYAGYNVGVMRQPSKVDAIITIYKTDNPDDVLFSVKYKKAEGNGAMGYDFDSGYRISESYAKLAKTLAKTINKKAW
ncbi:hypothetical protein [Patiriisocius marinus]|uniref:DUF4468 domain-containing protein n=1 Tax=Patiriisocius marinus TaxID=1397112 RepID=A0A5J4IMD3_9FLAO|nr:hypothetical protein [Patiriisocius marinus]GER58345.1 hypothetical protein ULMA_04530 [Patiriisocius marinus]